MKKKIIIVISAVVIVAVFVLGVLIGANVFQGDKKSAKKNKSKKKDKVKTEQTIEPEVIVAETIVMETEVVETSIPDSPRTLLVGFDPEFPPMGYMDEDGSYVGFDLDLAQEVCRRLGYEYVPVPMAWDMKDSLLSDGSIDCIWNGLTIEGREDRYAFTEPYLANRTVFVVREDSSIRTIADLEGCVVATLKDSTGSFVLSENPGIAGAFQEVLELDSYLNTFVELEAGNVDAILIDEIYARSLITTDYSNLLVLDESLYSEIYGVGFRMDDVELRDEIQSVLDDMTQDGTMAEISVKWFGEDITGAR